MKGCKNLGNQFNDFVFLNELTCCFCLFLALQKSKLKVIVF